MIKEEIRLKAVDNAERYEVWPPAADYQDGLIKGFEDGAEWMLDNPTGGALLYTVEKTAERTKREMIKKAERWLCKYFVEDHYGMSPAGFGVFFQMFEQAMQDESK
jgi:hypothetical protein